MCKAFGFKLHVGEKLTPMTVKYVGAQVCQLGPSRQSRFRSKQLNSIIAYTHHLNSSPHVHVLKPLRKRNSSKDACDWEEEASDLTINTTRESRTGGVQRFWVLAARACAGSSDLVSVTAN